MTDRSQFEAMLEALINEDQETAKELFHNIVVAKSREIYEELLESDFGKPEEDSEDSESDKDDIGGDATDDLESDVESDIDDAEEDAEEIEGGDEDMEDRVQDLEDALEDLKAEFEQLMAGEEGEEEHGDMFGGEEEPDMDMGGEEEPEMGGDDMEDESMGGNVTHVVHHNANDTSMPYESYASDEDLIREYVEKVGMDWDKASTGASGQMVGAHTGEMAGQRGEQNTKSVVDNMKNDMGGTVANIAQGHVEVHGDAGMKSKVEGPGVMKPSVVPNPDAKGNINVPGGKAGKTGFKTQVKGGGIDRQAGFDKPGKQVGATDSSGRGESNKRSPLNARK